MMFTSPNGYEVWVNLANSDLFKNVNYVDFGTINVMYTTLLHELGHNLGADHLPTLLAYDQAIIAACGTGI